MHGATHAYFCLEKGPTATTTKSANDNDIAYTFALSFHISLSLLLFFTLALIV